MNSIIIKPVKKDLYLNMLLYFSNVCISEIFRFGKGTLERYSFSVRPWYGVLSLQCVSMVSKY